MFLLWLRQLSQCGDWTPASVLLPDEGRSSPTNTSAFPPGSFILPSFVVIYILFLWSGTPVLSQLVFCMHFCLKVYSWCIRGERCTPHPPTPLPSCSPLLDTLNSFFTKFLGTFSTIATYLCQQDRQNTVQVHVSRRQTIDFTSLLTIWPWPSFFNIFRSQFSNQHFVI